MTLKPLYIDKSKVRKTLSNMTFKEDLIYPAHTLYSGEFTPYISKAAFDLAVVGLLDTDRAEEIIKQLGLDKPRDK